MPKTRKATHRTHAASPVPKLADLLAELEKADRKKIAPAVPDLEALIKKWSEILSGRPAFTTPNDLTLTQRKKHLLLAAARLDRARAALKEVPLHDQVYLWRNGGGDDLDARLTAARRACLLQAEALRGVPRFADPIRPRVASDVRALLEAHGIRCSRYPRGLFADVLTCIFPALGTALPEDLGPFLRATR